MAGGPKEASFAHSLVDERGGQHRADGDLALHGHGRGTRGGSRGGGGGLRAVGGRGRITREAGGGSNAQGRGAGAGQGAQACRGSAGAGRRAAIGSERAAWGGVAPAAGRSEQPQPRSSYDRPSSVFEEGRTAELRKNCRRNGRPQQRNCRALAAAAPPRPCNEPAARNVQQRKRGRAGNAHLP